MRVFILSLSIYLISSNISYAQVGIGTNTPNSSAQLEVSSTNKGILFPRMTSAQRTSIASPTNGLYVWDTNTKSLWYYDGATWVNTISEATFGDVKSGFQTNDHSGWIKLDGRAVNTLTASQQTIAVSLGFNSNLPDASTSYLVQNGNSMGAVSGANTVTLSQSNLPNVNFTGTAASAGDHTHSTDPASFNSGVAGWHDHWVDPPSTWTSTNGWHGHGSNASGGNGPGLQYQDGTWTPTSYDNYDIGVEDNMAYTLALQIYGNGDHAHTVDISGFWASGNGNHSHTIDVPATTSSTNGAHTHTVSVASGGSATPVNITPKSLSVNMFVYLGQ